MEIAKLNELKENKDMKRLSRRSVWFGVLAVLLAVLISTPYLWQRFYYDGPTAAFYELAAALEQNDKVKLEQLANKGVRAELNKLAKPFGGISKFGKHLRQSPRVNPVIHMLFTWSPQWTFLQQSKIEKLCSCSRGGKGGG
jgi:hypothetical protein